MRKLVLAGEFLASWLIGGLIYQNSTDHTSNPAGENLIGVLQAAVQVEKPFPDSGVEQVVEQDAHLQEYKSLKARLLNNRSSRRDYSYQENLQYLNSNLEALINYWYGTSYHKKGKTQEPNRGEIACGYFVSTLLSHLGFNHNREALGEKGAYAIIQTFCDKSTIRWFSNKPVSVLEDYVRTHGEGFYILGLDLHVGFVLFDGSNISFIHSNFYPPFVMKEELNESVAIEASGAKVIGKLFSPEYVEKYVHGTRIVIHN